MPLVDPDFLKAVYQQMNDYFPQLGAVNNNTGVTGLYLHWILHVRFFVLAILPIINASRPCAIG